MVLHSPGCGRVGRRRTSFRKSHPYGGGSFCFPNNFVRATSGVLITRNHRSVVPVPRRRCGPLVAVRRPEPGMRRWGGRSRRGEHTDEQRESCREHTRRPWPVGWSGPWSTRRQQQLGAWLARRWRSAPRWFVRRQRASSFRGLVAGRWPLLRFVVRRRWRSRVPALVRWPSVRRRPRLPSVVGGPRW